MLYDKYKHYVVINILFKFNITSIIDTYFLAKVSIQSTLQSLLEWAYLDSRSPDFVGVMQVLFYCISLVVIISVLIKPVLIKSFEMKQPFMVWIGFISICCAKVAKDGKSCPRLLVLQRVAQNAKSCSKVAEHNLFMPIVYGWHA